MSDIKKIFTNSGHTDTDPGAVGYEIERKLAVKVTGYMNEHLIENYVCELKSMSGTIAAVTAVANEWGADLFVSNHFNAGGGDGYEALVYSEKSKALGKVFEKHVKAAGQNSRGVKYRPDLGVLKRTKMSAVLNEGAFVDNWKDIKDWNDDAELKVLGIAYAKAAAEYLDLPKKKKPAASSSDDYLVRIKIKDLYIRTGPGTKYKHKGFIKPGMYTIVETKDRWGRLKSGAGWICLDYVTKL